MSILGRVTTNTQNVRGTDLLMLAVLVALSLLSIGVAAICGVFRRGSVVGPPRVDENESLGTIVVLLGMGIILLVMTQALCVMPAGASTATTAPAAPSAGSTPDDVGKMALVSSVPPITAFAFLVVTSRTLRPRGLRGLGLAGAQIKSGVVAGLVGSLIMVPLVFVIAEVTERVWRAIQYTHPTEHELLRDLGQSQNPWIGAVLILSAALVAPLFEETLFRGQIQTLITYMWVRLRRRQPQGVVVVAPVDLAANEKERPILLPYESIELRPGPQPWMRWLSIVVTSVLFSALHPAWSIPPIFFLSLCLGYAYERTGNLWTTITMHALFNTTSTVLFMVLMR